MKRVRSWANATIERITARLRYAKEVLLGSLRIAAKRVSPTVKVLLPQIFIALSMNRRIHRNFQPEVRNARATVDRADAVDLSAAIALWQFETDRFNGLAAKGAAVLAADAIVATGLATQTSSQGIPAYLCVTALIYLGSATAAVFVVQRPTSRRVAQPRDVLDGTASNAMVAAVIANQPTGIQMQNLVYVGIRDTSISLVLLLTALAYKLVL